MAVIQNMQITNRGKVLYSKVQAGNPLKFTKFKIGAGKITNENIEELEDLIDYKFDASLISIVPLSSTRQAKITATFNNNDLEESYYICEFGLYAEDPQEGEILYGYATAGEYGDYLAPISQGAYTWMWEVNAAVGNTSNITIDVNALSFDIGLLNTNENLTIISGSNQYEINQKADTLLEKHEELVTSNTGDLNLLKLKFAILSATLSYGMQNNAFLLNFDDIDDISLSRGIWDKENKKVYV